VVSAFIRRFVFDEARGQAWIRHDIQQAENVESFLPALHAVEGH
jgi:hypothetical protein